MPVTKGKALQPRIDRLIRKKQVIDQRIAQAPQVRGTVIVLTGNGKGKSSSAWGMLARSLGHGKQAAVVQFIKHRRDCGETRFFAHHPQVKWHIMGRGFTWESKADDGKPNPEQDKVAALEAWDVSCQLLANQTIDLLILDEFTYTFKYGWLTAAEVITALHHRPPDQHVIITGRGAPRELVEYADTVTEMQMIKHAFQAGISAMPGIEY